MKKTLLVLLLPAMLLAQPSRQLPTHVSDILLDSVLTEVLVNSLCNDEFDVFLHPVWTVDMRGDTLVATRSLGNAVGAAVIFRAGTLLGPRGDTMRYQTIAYLRLWFGHKESDSVVINIVRVDSRGYLQERLEKLYHQYNNRGVLFKKQQTLMKRYVLDVLRHESERR